MPLITVKAATPLIPAGTYPATLISIAPKRMVTQYSKNGEEQDFLEWTWVIDGAEITSLTTVASGPKSRINEYLVALVGADNVKVDANFDEADLVGKVVLAQVIINDDGFSKIDRLMAAPREVRNKPAEVPAKPAKAEATVSPKRDEIATEAPTEAGLPDDDLPF